MYGNCLYCHCNFFYKPKTVLENNLLKIEKDSVNEHILYAEQHARNMS